MLRLVPSTWGVPVHDHPGWWFLRRQLTGRPDWGRGSVPSLPALAREFESLQRQMDERKELPLASRGGGKATFTSLRQDLHDAVHGAGPEVVRIAAAKDTLRALETDAPTRPDWENALAAGSAIATRLGTAEAADASLDDVLQTARALDDDRDYDRLTDRIESLRAITEFRGAPWKLTSNRLERVLTVHEVDDEGHASSGLFPAGTPVADLVDEMRQRVRTPPPVTTWAIWIATLAGPRGLEHGNDVTMSGPVAVCGLPCSAPLNAWFARAQKIFSKAFQDAGSPVPPDVQALGAPRLFRGEVISDSDSLWGALADPPSFLSRVAVEARTHAEAEELAFAALRAVFGRYDHLIAADLRPDAWVWGPSGEWGHATSSRNRGLGEIFATRSAAAAVHHWADDLGPTLDRDRLTSLQARTLVADDRVAADVRLLRAATRLDGMRRQPGGWVEATRNLWLRHAQSLIVDDQRHLFSVALDFRDTPPADDRSYQEVRKAQDAVRAAAEATGFPAGTALMDAVKTALEPVHREALARELFRVVDAELDSNDAMTRIRQQHALACSRAQRHRNIVAHGWTLPDAVLLPTVEFLGRQLELAVMAQGEASAYPNSKLGSLFRRPPDRVQRSTLRAWLDRNTQTD